MKSERIREPKFNRFASTKLQIGYEKSLFVPELRLSGRPDEMERASDGTICIADLKSGSVFDKDGKVYKAYAYQLQLYALMVEQIDPGAALKLFLKGLQRIEILWNDDIRYEIRKKLDDVSNLLPEGELLSAESVANVGNQCFYCKARHKCPSYLRAAPNWWHERSSMGKVAPFDIWGRVVDLERHVEDIDVIVIQDRTGRKSRIQGLKSHLQNIQLNIGDEIYFFDLEPSEDIPMHNLFTHPRNFHAKSPSQRWRDAIRMRFFKVQS